MLTVHSALLSTSIYHPLQTSWLRGKNTALQQTAAPIIVCAPRTEFCDKDTQQKWFRKHFELASQFHLPMFFHMRAAAPDFITILKEHRSATTLMEKFAAPVHMLASWLDHEHASHIIKPAEHMHSTILSILPS